MKTILFSLAAAFFTATSSFCQRLGARSLEQTSRFDFEILFRLARKPVWLLGVLSMICGFIFQISALHVGELALVQPILSAELLFVFLYMSLISARPVKRRDWLAVLLMTAGLALFLFIASPSGGTSHAPSSSWWLAGVATFGVVFVLVGLSFRKNRLVSSSSTHRAAILGVATGISWGFVAAVIKELSSHLGEGIGSILSTWSFYVLIFAGAGTMLLAAHALRSGPLAASQPGFTIADPVVASLLGVYLFQEHIRHSGLDLFGEFSALAILIAGIVLLSHSQLIDPEVHSRRGC